MDNTSSFDPPPQKKRWNAVIRSAGCALCLSDPWSEKCLAARFSEQLVQEVFTSFANDQLHSRKKTHSGDVGCEQCASQTGTTRGGPDDWLSRHFDKFLNNKVYQCERQSFTCQRTCYLQHWNSAVKVPLQLSNDWHSIWGVWGFFQLICWYEGIIKV